MVIEDVVTSGGQVIDSCRRLRALGAEITIAVCVIDRHAGGTANLAKESIELRSLFTMDQLKASASSS